jgi:hypothetical protein
LKENCAGVIFVPRSSLFPLKIKAGTLPMRCARAPADGRDHGGW